MSVAEHLPLHRLELWCDDGVRTAYVVVVVVVTWNTLDLSY